MHLHYRPDHRVCANAPVPTRFAPRRTLSLCHIAEWPDWYFFPSSHNCLIQQSRNPWPLNVNPLGAILKKPLPPPNENARFPNFLVPHEPHLGKKEPRQRAKNDRAHEFRRPACRCDTDHQPFTQILLVRFLPGHKHFQIRNARFHAIIIRVRIPDDEIIRIRRFLWPAMK